MRRALAIAAHVALFVGFGACQYTIAMRCAALRADDAMTTCMGPRDARVRFVYLHGLDSRGPSWQELDNRRALAALPDAAIALPRAPLCDGGRCWPDSDEGTGEVIGAIRGAARACFGEHASYGVVGFSRGGFALARLATCDAAGARWAIVASAFGYGDEPRLRGCPVAVVVGRGDRYHHDGAVGYSQRSHAPLFEFAGGHRLDAPALAQALAAVAPR
ncbi:MAG: hypothetical protein ACM31C_08590 [Acidobacteriota bacterium]